MTSHPLQPTGLEVVAGFLLGEGGPPEPLPEAPAGLTPRRAFEEALLPALSRPPCIVTFSGGRDSSTVLAVALELARREGLPAPVPASIRFLGAPGADETDWQERTARALAVEDWLRIEVAEELDFLGPIATRILRRHGVVYPAHACLLERLLDETRGGSLLTGFGGDPVLGGWSFRGDVEAAAGRARPRPRTALFAAYASTPAVLRRAYFRRQARPPRWLRPAARRAVAREWAARRASEPLSWRRYLAWQVSRRRTLALEHTSRLLADAAGAYLAHPFLDRRFVAALARAGGRLGLRDRTAAMHAVFGGRVPDAVLAREDKAVYDLVYFRSYTREFARDFDGKGIEPELADAELLRGEWSAHLPDARCVLALQAAWLASAAARDPHELLGDRR